MRSIDADALERALGYLWVVTTPRDTDDKETSLERAAMCRGIDVCIGIVQRAPTVGGWISVDDRLPEVKMSDVDGKIAFSDYVLIYKVREDGTPRMTVDTCRVDKAAWMTAIPGEGWTVTHWMPLPEPPEEYKND